MPNKMTSPASRMADQDAIARHGLRYKYTEKQTQAISNSR